jgi:hypothetical protein
MSVMHTLYTLYIAPSLTGPIVGGVLVFIVAALTAVVILVVITYLVQRYNYVNCSST